jgi:hypothetical protein
MCNLLYHKTINCIVILCLLLNTILFARSKIDTSEVIRRMLLSFVVARHCGHVVIDDLLPATTRL